MIHWENRRRNLLIQAVLCWMKAASLLTASHMRKTFFKKDEPKKYIQNIVSSTKQTLCKFNLALALNWSKSKLKVIKTKHWELTFSSRYETTRSHVLNFGTTSAHNVLYMRSYVMKDISRFRLLSWGQRRLLLKVPIASKEPLIYLLSDVFQIKYMYTVLVIFQCHLPFSV